MKEAEKFIKDRLIAKAKTERKKKFIQLVDYSEMAEILQEYHAQQLSSKGSKTAEEMIKQANIEAEKWEIEQSTVQEIFGAGFEYAQQQTKAKGLPSDEEAERKAERFADCRNPNNDPKEEYIYGFLACHDWIQDTVNSTSPEHVEPEENITRIVKNPRFEG